MPASKSGLVYESSVSGGVSDSFLSLTRARRFLDYEPSVSLVDGLRWMIEGK